jgi:hypothetical protein
MFGIFASSFGFRYFDSTSFITSDMFRPISDANSTEITYKEEAGILGVSPRAVHDILRAHEKLCRPITYGYRTVRFGLDAVLTVQSRHRQRPLK